MLLIDQAIFPLLLANCKSQNAQAYHQEGEHCEERSVVQEDYDRCEEYPSQQEEHRVHQGDVVRVILLQPIE